MTRITSYRGTDLAEARAVGCLDGVSDAAAAWFDQHGWSIPAKYEVCDRCGGRGTHDHPAFSNGFTGDEMDEAGPDFREEYMAGHYDVRCTVCDGKRVTLVCDEEACNEHERELVHELDEWAASDAETDAMHAAERRMGA